MTLTWKRTSASLVVLLLCLINTPTAAQMPRRSEVGVSQTLTPQKRIPPQEPVAVRPRLTVASSMPAGGEESRPSLVQLRNDSRSTPVFIENVGQFDSTVRFMVKIGANTVWLTAGGLVFDALQNDGNAETSGSVVSKPASRFDLLPLPKSASR